MTSRLDSRLLGFVLAIAGALGCAAKDPPGPATPPVLQVALTAHTPSGLPQCTAALRGTTAATESPAGIWSCQGNTWLPIPCTNGLAGAVAYASATKSLWACTAGQWVSVVLPQGPAGETGAPGKDGKDGRPGATSIVAQTVEPPGASCPNGGTRIASGLDLDGDQRLSDGEAMQIAYVCNGAAGPAGANGAPGALLTVTPEPAGTNCPNGGQRIGVGVDTNGSGALDDSEITGVSYVCNGGTAVPPQGGGGGAGDLTVSCTSPAPNGLVEAAPGTLLEVSGVVAGGSGATTLKVNDVPTPLDAGGGFTASITSRYGANHLVLEAADGAGHVRRGLCSYLIADQFVDEGAPLPGATALRLGQAAIDDGDRTGPINSLADALAAALNSEGLHTALDTGLKAANPLKDDDPYYMVYVSSSLPGPNTVNASLVDGGVRARVRFEDPLIRMHVSYDLFPLDIDATGDVNVDYVDVDVTFDVGRDDGGRLRASLRAINVDVGPIDTNFTGVEGFIINTAVDVANGTLRSGLASSLQSAVRDNFNDTLGALLSGLGVIGFETAFAVPHFDGTGDTPITFAAGFSDVEVSAARLLVGISSRFSAPAAHDRQPSRVPLPPGAVQLDPGGPQPVAVAAHVGVVQQALQANWRGGGLDGTVMAATGANVTFATTLPPVVFIKDDGSLAIDLCVDASVSLPGAAAPIQARVAVRAGGPAALSSDDLVFSAVTLDEAHVAIPEGELSPADASTLRDTLTGLLAQMAERSLNDALPRLPVPAFKIPAALGIYGLPVGETLGLVSATLATSGQHAVLRGGFGVR